MLSGSSGPAGMLASTASTTISPSFRSGASHHNDQAVRLAVGDVAFVDAAQPVTYFADNNGAPWNTVTLNLPRQLLVSHLGFEPKGGLYRRGGTRAGHLLFDLIQESGQVEGSCPLIHICILRSMISSAHYLRRPIHGPSRTMRISCSPVSAASARRALPIRILVQLR
jgi:hypothetical protein